MAGSAWSLPEGTASYVTSRPCSNDRPYFEGEKRVGRMNKCRLVDALGNMTEGLLGREGTVCKARTTSLLPVQRSQVNAMNKLAVRQVDTKMVDVFAPPLSLLCKLGSIVVHVEEGARARMAHAYDWAAIRSLLADREVQGWIEGMRNKALVPVKRR